MGLRSWILGDYVKELQQLEERVKTLEEKVNDLGKSQEETLRELLQLQKSLEEKANRKDMERELESLSKLVMAVYDKLKELEAYSEFSPGESLDPESEEILVLDLIRQGYTSPSELVSRLKFGNKKLYAILKRLEAKGKLRKLRKKRKVHYVLVEG